MTYLPLCTSSSQSCTEKLQPRADCSWLPSMPSCLLSHNTLLAGFCGPFLSSTMLRTVRRADLHPLSQENSHIPFLHPHSPLLCSPRACPSASAAQRFSSFSANSWVSVSQASGPGTFLFMAPEALPYCFLCQNEEWVDYPSNVQGGTAQIHLETST